MACLPKADIITTGMILQDYSGAGVRGWCSEVGVERFDVIRLAGASTL
jgi:hypothetical protein